MPIANVRQSYLDRRTEFGEATHVVQRNQFKNAIEAPLATRGTYEPATQETTIIDVVRRHRQLRQPMNSQKEMAHLGLVH
jgi:hypothetical protein